MNNTDLNFVAFIQENPEVFKEALLRHLVLTVFSVGIAIILAIPLAILASRMKSLAGPLNWLANVGQTIPSLAILGLSIPILGIGFKAALLALTIRAVLPIFLNTYIGISQANPMVIDAARGMGATSFQRLLMTELPLASPVILAGVRTATVQAIGIATLAAYIGGGGLGDLILQGLSLVDVPVLLAGAVPVAALAMLAELLLGGLSRVLIPVSLREGA